jgi:hypothetical protein
MIGNIFEDKQQSKDENPYVYITSKCLKNKRNLQLLK